MATPNPVTDRERAARDNRERYPEFAAWVDELRRVFGDVKVTRFVDKQTEEA